jgi:hypothetical protein
MKNSGKRIAKQLPVSRAKQSTRGAGHRKNIADQTRSVDPFRFPETTAGNDVLGIGCNSHTFELFLIEILSDCLCLHAEQVKNQTFCDPHEGSGSAGSMPDEK